MFQWCQFVNNQCLLFHISSFVWMCVCVCVSLYNVEHMSHVNTTQTKCIRSQLWKYISLELSNFLRKALVFHAISGFDRDVCVCVCVCVCVMPHGLQDHVLDSRWYEYLMNIAVQNVSSLVSLIVLFPYSSSFTFLFFFNWFILKHFQSSINISLASRYFAILLGRHFKKQVYIFSSYLRMFYSVQFYITEEFYFQPHTH